MILHFTKMHGAGNDFIVAFRKPGMSVPDKDAISSLCNRKRGIGADGLIFVSENPHSDIPYRMDYFNSDGSPAGMCGNGLRCAALYCHTKLGSKKRISIMTASGPLEAAVISKNSVRVSIPVTKNFGKISLDGDEMYFGSTGVPHLVKIVKDIGGVPVCAEGRRLRHHSRFAPAGTNVDFISPPPGNSDGPYRIRTYERGVEDETSACGTGISASAVCLMLLLRRKPPFKFMTQEGDVLKVEFRKSDNILKPPAAAYLTGPAVEVFSGEIKI